MHATSPAADPHPADGTRGLFLLEHWKLAAGDDKLIAWVPEPLAAAGGEDQRLPLWRSGLWDAISEAGAADRWEPGDSKGAYYKLGAAVMAAESM